MLELPLFKKKKKKKKKLELANKYVEQLLYSGVLKVF